MVIFILVDAFVGIGVAALTFAQTSQVSRNVTTNELANWHRYKYLQTADGAFNNPFNKGERARRARGRSATRVCVAACSSDAVAARCCFLSLPRRVLEQLLGGVHAAQDAACARVPLQRLVQHTSELRARQRLAHGVVTWRVTAAAARQGFAAQGKGAHRTHHCIRERKARVAEVVSERASLCVAHTMLSPMPDAETLRVVLCPGCCSRS